MEELSTKASAVLKRKTLKYTILDGNLYRRIVDWFLLKCVSTIEAITVIGQVHEGLCDFHRSRYKMKWLIHRHDYFWPTISVHCVKYVRT